MNPSHAELEAFLGERGFVRLPLESNAVGHFELRGELNGTPVRLLLDTGASMTVLDRAAALRLGVPLVESEQRGGGVGTSESVVERVSVESLRLHGMEVSPGSLYVLDLTHVNQSLARHGGQPIDGAVGGDILRPREAVIDYANAALYLRRTA